MNSNYDKLLSRRIATERDAVWSQGDLESAQVEIVEISTRDPRFRDGWHRARGSFNWFNRWNGEIDPARLLGRHMGISENALWRFPIGLSGVDAILQKADGQETELEFTLAFEDHSGGTAVSEAGYQDALRWEKVALDGSADAYALHHRDKTTGLIVEAGPRRMRSSEEVYGNWARGIEAALRRKGSGQKVPGYGSGSILCVYAAGFSGHPPFNACDIHFDYALGLVSLDAFPNQFKKTTVFSRHKGWCRHFESTV